MNKTDYTYSRSPSYSRKAESPFYQIPNMSRLHVGDSMTSNTIGDLYVSSDEEDYITGTRTSTRTVYDDGILLRSGNSLKNKRTVRDGTYVRNINKNAKETSSSLYSLNTNISNVRESRGTARSSRMRRSQASDHVTSTNQISEMRSSTRSSSASMSSMSKSSKSSIMDSLQKTLSSEFDDSEMEKGMKETQNSSRKIKLYGLDQVDSEMSGMESEVEFTGTNMSAYGSDSSAARKRLSNSQSETNTNSESSSSVMTTTTTTTVTTIIESIAGKPVWQKPVWLMRNGIRRIFNSCGFVTRRILSTAFSVIVQKYIWELGLFSRMSRQSRLCCIILPLLLLLPLLIYTVYPFTKPVAFTDSQEKDSQNLSGMEGLSHQELNEEVRRIILQLYQGGEKSVSKTEEERLMASLANQKSSMKETATIQVEKINVTEEILRVLQQLNVRGDALTEGDIRAIVGQVVQHEVTGLQNQIKEQSKAQMSGTEEHSERILMLQNDLRTSVTNLEQKLGEELDRMKSQSVLDSDTLTVEASARLLQIQGNLSSIQARLDSLELEKQWLAAQLKNCCRNESFYMTLVQDKVNLILGQIMSGNDSGSTDQYVFGAWLNSTFIRKSDFEKHKAEFGQELSEKILQEMSRTEAIGVNVSGGQYGLTEKAVMQIVSEALDKFSADKIALPDFALESAGGSIISTKCSQTFHKNTARLSILGIPLWYVSNSPRSVIQPEMQPGSCWAFQGSKGHLVIELSANITPSAFTLEHIPKSLSADGKIDSAPKGFTVLGLRSENDVVGVHIGNFTYLDSGPPLQTFKIQKSNVGAYKLIQLSILSNHGNPLYTCLYRFRVHGVPYKPPKPTKKSAG
ncbi:SUN domain-containing protein 2-like isoform X2 [Ostrea edulis]|nr:SUN domain-containing protein 2-like isoform X2 [Ostrea edulis]